MLCTRGRRIATYIDTYIDTYIHRYSKFPICYSYIRGSLRLAPNYFNLGNFGGITKFKTSVNLNSPIYIIRSDDLRLKFACLGVIVKVLD